MNEADYRRVTYDLTLGAATTLARLNPQMTFTYVTGRSTDSTEKGSSMWARVKGETENALLRLPFKAAYMFRPGAIRPTQRLRGKSALFQATFTLAGPLLDLLVRVAPNHATTSARLGQAMLIVARRGAPKSIIESIDINSMR